MFSARSACSLGISLGMSRNQVKKAIEANPDAVAVLVELSKPKPSPADDIDDGEDENQGFEISM